MQLSPGGPNLRLTKPCSTASPYGETAVHLRVWNLGWGCVPRASRPKFCPVVQHFTKLELFSLFFSDSLVKLQIANTSSAITACGSLCKLCCDLWSKALTFPDVSLVPLCPRPYRMGAGMCIYKSQGLGEHILV